MMTHLHRAAAVLRRVPFTATFVTTVGALAVVASGPGFAARPEIIERWGFSLDKLMRGEVWTLGTATLLLHRPSLFPVTAAFVAGAVGGLEWRAGTRRALVVFWTSDVAGSLVVAVGIVLPLWVGDVPLGERLANAHDVGISGGTYACLGALIGRMPSRWRGLPVRRIATGSVAAVVAGQLATPGALEAALLHAVAAPLGWGLDHFLSRRSPHPYA